MSDLLFVYGSLVDGGPDAEMSGFTKHTDAPFPTVSPGGDAVAGQIRRVDDWAETDRYEGCKPDNPEESLYWRLVSSDGVHVYVGNPDAAESVWGRSWDVDYTLEEVREAVADTGVLD